MASDIDICNLALARLGDSATVASIDPPEGSPQATHCARFYPLARDTALERHSWAFATTRGTLSRLSATPTTGWLYAYARPSNAVSIIALFESGATDDFAPQPFETESLEDGTEVIYSNVDNAVCRYTLQVTDTSKYSGLFIEAVSWLLASHLAGPVLKGDKGTAATVKCYQMFENQLALAKGADTRQRKVQPTHNVGWIEAR